MTRRETGMIIWPPTKIDSKNLVLFKKSTAFGYKINNKVKYFKMYANKYIYTYT